MSDGESSVVNAAGTLAMAVKPPVFDTASIRPPRGQMDGSGKFSPNLYHWVVRHWGGRFGGRGLEQTPEVFRDTDGSLWIGRLAGGMFVGQRLMRVMCGGISPSMAVCCWTRRSHKKLKLLKNFWRDYRRIGRCAIDRAHRIWWQCGDARWTVKGKTRTCNWCGKHKQRLMVKVKTERTVTRTWKPV